MIIQVKIGKNKYKINCQESEKDLIFELADKIDSRIDELRSNIEEQDEINLLVITALMIERELQNKNSDNLYSEDDLLEAISEQMDNVATFIEKITNRIENL